MGEGSYGFDSIVKKAEEDFKKSIEKGFNLKELKDMLKPHENNICPKTGNKYTEIEGTVNTLYPLGGRRGKVTCCSECGNEIGFSGIQS